MMKYRLAIEVWGESTAPQYFTILADTREPYLEFDQLEDVIAALGQIAGAMDDEEIREYAAEVQREGAVTERVLRRWKKTEVTLQGEIEKAVAASRKPASAGSTGQ